MKNYVYLPAAALCTVLFLGACDDGSGTVTPVTPLRAAYVVALPDIPPAWETMLGNPEWRLEWLNSAGEKTETRIQSGDRAEIAPPESWASPVSAWPCWPGRGIGPGTFRPAGAIFPFDVADGTVTLSWQGGVDAVLYWELAAAAAEAAAEDAAAADADAAGMRAAVPRLPQLFNWPRFRELFAEESGIKEEVRLDPWLADWRTIAGKIAASGFDKRRLVSAARKKLPVPAAGPGPWVGSSPFAEPLLFEGPPEFPVRETPDTWVSQEGILRCTTQTWIWLPWE
jgi:hypothetical protein